MVPLFSRRRGTPLHYSLKLIRANDNRCTVMRCNSKINCSKQFFRHVIILAPIVHSQPKFSTPNMTGRRFHCTMEMIPPPAPGSLKRSLFPTLFNEVQNKGTQGVRARYGAELPPIISIVRYPGRPVILGMEILREAKPGCFQTRGFPIFLGKVQIVSRTLSGLVLVGALNRPRKRKRTDRENPRANRKNPRKIEKVPKRTKKEGQVQIGKPPGLKPPRLAALENYTPIGNRCENGSKNILLCHWHEIFQENSSQTIFPCNSLNRKREYV